MSRSCEVTACAWTMVDDAKKRMTARREAKVFIVPGFQPRNSQNPGPSVENTMQQLPPANWGAYPRWRYLEPHYDRDQPCHDEHDDNKACDVEQSPRLHHL